MRTAPSLHRTCVALLAAVVAFLAAPGLAGADQRTYTLVQNSSTIAISGTVDGTAITAQGTNNFGQSSLVARYSGDIVTDRVSNTINTISFLGGSTIDAVVNGNWRPTAGGASGGTAAADYGGKTAVSGADVQMAGRNLVADFLTTGSPINIVNGQFDLSTSDVNLTAGDVDYRVFFDTIFGDIVLANGSNPLAGEGGSLAGTATISTQSLGGGMLRETLTAPVSSTLPPVVVSGYNIILTLTGTLVATSDFADTGDRYWITSAGGTFATTTNWNPSLTPSTTETAVFDLGGNYTVTIGASATNNRLRIENDQVAFALGTNTYALSNTSATTPSIIAGAAAGDNGRLSLTGTGAGGSLSSISAFLGSVTSSTGQVTVGSLASWNNSQELSVGRAGTGTLTINSGGKVIAPLGGISYVGHTAGASGTATVSGSGSTWTNDQLFVGRGGTALLTVQSTGTLNSVTANIGALAGSNGTLTITGSGTTWNNTGSAYVGGTSAAAGGTGVLNVNSSATVNITSTLRTWTGGTINLNSGKLKTSTLNISQGVFNHIGGQLVATTVTGNLNRSGGTLTPGDTLVAGLTSVSGSYTQQSGATLAIELGGTSTSQFDRLTIGGSVSLAGTLTVSLINSFVPAWGNSIQILTAVSGRTGTFATVNLPGLSSSNLEWLTTYGPTSGSTFVTFSVGLKGDFNGNGRVDAADYAVWRNTGGSAAQYNSWRSMFGITVSGSGSSLPDTSGAIPEPTGFTLAAAASIAAVMRKRRRR